MNTENKHRKLRDAKPTSKKKLTEHPNKRQN